LLPKEVISPTTCERLFEKQYQAFLLYFYLLFVLTAVFIALTIILALKNKSWLFF